MPRLQREGDERLIISLMSAYNVSSMARDSQTYNKADSKPFPVMMLISGDVQYCGSVHAPPAFIDLRAVVATIPTWALMSLALLSL